MRQDHPCKHFCFYTIRFILTLTLLHSVSSETAVAKDLEKLRVATFVWPQRTDTDGTGAYFDVLRHIYQPHELSLDITYGSIQDALGSLYRNETDIMLVEWHPDILRTDPKIKHELILAPKFPMDTEQVVAVSHSARSLPWQRVLSGRSHHLAWIADYNYHYFLNVRDHPRTLVKSTMQGLKLVQRGRIDTYLDDISDVEIALNSEAFIDTEFSMEVVKERNLYPLFNHPSHQRGLMKMYNQGMQRMLENGTLKDIFEHHNLNFDRIRFPKD